MDIMMIGSINQYVKRTELKQVWKLRQENQDTPKGKMTLDQWVHAQQDKTKAPSAPVRPDLPEPPDLKLGSIESKVNHGQPLTSSERSYLREHSPKLLERAEENERTKKSFERELKQCHTQDDVRRLKMKYANASLTKVNAVVNNPNISKAQKLEICLQENGKMMAVEQAAAEHIRSGAYAKLPTEEEVRAAEQAQQEREEDLREQSADAVVDTAENQPQPEEIETAQPEAVPSEERKPEFQPETQDEQKVKRAKVSAYRRPLDKVDSEGFTPVQSKPFTPPSSADGTLPVSDGLGLDARA